MAMNSRFSMTESDTSSSTKTSFDLLDDFFFPIQRRGSEVDDKKFDGDSDGGSGSLKARVQQRPNAKGQRQGKKEEEKRGPLNRFTTVKTQPIRPA
jgi:hypothetical protein